MTTLTGKTIANTYKDLLQVSNSNSGIDSTLRNVSDGEGTSSPLQLSNDTINLTGTIKLQGETLTANVSALNNMADITGATGLIAVNSGTAYGRTIVVTEPLSIGNADGTAGNPTIGLAVTGITSATYGPLGQFNVDVYGRVISVSVATTVSANSFIGGVFDGSSLTIENNTTIGNDLIVKGTTNMKAVSATDITFNNGTATTKITSPTISATTVNTSILNVAVASISDLYAANLTFTNASIANFNATNFFAVSANATRLFKNGEDVATSATVATLSATMATSINNSNTVIAAVSVLTKTNLDAVTSINTVVGNLSATMATSIGNSNAAIATNTAAITSINTVVGDLSATMATSIGNSNAAITSINAIIGDGGNYATSAELHALSVTMATSINNSNTVIAAVSVLTKTNLDAITSINIVVGDLSATMATSINNRTTAIATNTAAITSINIVVGNLSATMATSINNRTTAIATNTEAITSINIVVAAVSVLTKTNLDAVTSINTVVTNLSATMATSISNVNGAAVAFAIALG